MKKIQTFIKPSDIFKKNKVLKLEQLSDIIICSDITIRRRLKEWSAITSFNHNGMYYTLPSIAEFDLWGLWCHDDIRFSKYGNLTKTIIGIVHCSPEGLNTTQIKELINCNAHSILKRLVKDASIAREKYDGKYVYFSNQKEQFSIQLDKRQSMSDSSKRERELPCFIAVQLLVEKIKQPGKSLEELVLCLQQRRVDIRLDGAINFFNEHEIEKKT